MVVVMNVALLARNGKISCGVGNSWGLVYCGSISVSHHVSGCSRTGSEYMFEFETLCIKQWAWMNI